MAGWKKTADVIIIGGGIIGTSIAHALASEGRIQIILLERDLLARASTGLSVGGIRQQFSLRTNILLSQATIQILQEFKKAGHTDLHIHQVGYLLLAQGKKTWDDLQESVQVQRALNVPVEKLTPSQIARRWPYIHAEDLEGGTFCPEDGYIDPYLVTMAFARQARKLGVLLLENTPVTGILMDKNRVAGVNTARGKISAPIVVNAAGPWAAEIGKMAQVFLPVSPFRRQVFATKAFPLLPRPVPMIIDMDPRFYFRGEGSGLLMGMTDPGEPSGFSTHVDREFMEKVTEMAILRAPCLEQAEILRGWAGLYAVTPDENPIIGRIPEKKGFLCAVGFSGHGFQHGPSVGRVISNLILSGQTEFDMAPFSCERFQKGHLSREKAAV